MRVKVHIPPPNRSVAGVETRRAQWRPSGHGNHAETGRNHRRGRGLHRAPHRLLIAPLHLHRGVDDAEIGRDHWRKLHIAVDAGTGEITACLLTDIAADIAGHVPALLAATSGELVWVTADGAYTAGRCTEPLPCTSPTRYRISSSHRICERPEGRHLGCRGGAGAPPPVGHLAAAAAALRALMLAATAFGSGRRRSALLVSNARSHSGSCCRRNGRSSRMRPSASASRARW